MFLIELGSQGYWELFSSRYALEEARRNLERKFPHSLDGLGALVHHICIIEHRAGFAHPEGLVRKDQPIFQAASACQATHLLTGDLKDFGPFMNQPENTFCICIQTVAEFLRYQLAGEDGTSSR